MLDLARTAQQRMAASRQFVRVDRCGDHVIGTAVKDRGAHLVAVVVGPVTDESFKEFPDLSPRELFTQVPFAILCLVIGIVPFVLLNVFDLSITHLLQLIGMAQ